MMIALRARVWVSVIDGGRVVKLAGIVVGRTRSDDPTYTICLDSGKILIDKPANVVERRGGEQVVEHPETK